MFYFILIDGRQHVMFYPFGCVSVVVVAILMESTEHMTLSLTNLIIIS